jgi:hypothetical protein
MFYAVAVQTVMNGSAIHLPHSGFYEQAVTADNSSRQQHNGTMELGSHSDYGQMQGPSHSSLATVAQWVQQQNAYQQQRNLTSSFSSDAKYGAEAKTGEVQCGRVHDSNSDQYWNNLSVRSSVVGSSNSENMVRYGNRVSDENLTMEQRQIREAKCAQLNQLRMLLFRQVPYNNQLSTYKEKRLACATQYVGQPGNVSLVMEGKHIPPYYEHPSSAYSYRMTQPQRDGSNFQQDYHTTKIRQQQTNTVSGCQSYCWQNTCQSSCCGYGNAECRSRCGVTAWSAPVCSTQMPTSWDNLGQHGHIQHNKNSYSYLTNDRELQHSHGLMSHQQPSSSIHPPASQVSSLVEHAGIFDPNSVKSEVGMSTANIPFMEHVSPGKRKYSDSDVVEYETDSRSSNYAVPTLLPWQVSYTTTGHGHISMTSEQNKQAYTKSNVTSRLGPNLVSASAVMVNTNSAPVIKVGMTGSSKLEHIRSTTLYDTGKSTTFLPSRSVPCSGLSSVFTVASTLRSTSWSNITSTSLVSLMQNVEALPVSGIGDAVQAGSSYGKPQSGVTSDGASSSDNSLFNRPPFLSTTLQSSSVRSLASASCVGAETSLPLQLLSVGHDVLKTAPNMNCIAKVKTADQLSCKSDCAVSVGSTRPEYISVASVHIHNKAPNTISYHPAVSSVTSLSSTTDNTRRHCRPSIMEDFIDATAKYDSSPGVSGVNDGLSAATVSMVGVGDLHTSRQQTYDAVLQEQQSGSSFDSKRPNWIANDLVSSQRQMTGCNTRAAPTLEHAIGSGGLMASCDNSTGKQSNDAVVPVPFEVHHSDAGFVKRVYSGSLMRLAGGHMVETADSIRQHDNSGMTGFELADGITQPRTPLRANVLEDQPEPFGADCGLGLETCVPRVCDSSTSLPDNVQRMERNASANGLHNEVYDAECKQSTKRRIGLTHAHGLTDLTSVGADLVNTDFAVVPDTFHPCSVSAGRDGLLRRYERPSMSYTSDSSTVTSVSSLNTISPSAPLTKTIHYRQSSLPASQYDWSSRAAQQSGGNIFGTFSHGSYSQPQISPRKSRVTAGGRQEVVVSGANDHVSTEVS